ncbi:MAG: AAA family ATPase [Acidobacteriia bacterium]|nr:AAA family ATPase [Terriglobia bacterium]
MPISTEVRRLSAKWSTGVGWPKRLDWIEIQGIHGWTGQRIELRYPIMAVIGENGAGKSTILQCAASVYSSQKSPEKKKVRYASDFFPDTRWEKIEKAEIRYSLREGTTRYEKMINKPTGRWRGNPERRERNVIYADLRRIQPVGARVGYARLAKPNLEEANSEQFGSSKLVRFKRIMNREYEVARMVTTSIDSKRSVPVIMQRGQQFSGFHQGAGETTVAELIKPDFPQYSLVLIDEVETSLHPRAQRRLIRDLAEKCRELELQVILTTHSPYVLDELPLKARAHILEIANTRQIIYEVSPEFAMSKMDDVPQPECDLYVEDERAERLLIEILIKHGQQLIYRCRTIICGTASVGQALGQMVAKKRWRRPTCVFLDGDQGVADGCINLPGSEAPEIVVFQSLKSRNWLKLHERTGRLFSEVIDACTQAMVLADHHDWIKYAASKLLIGGDFLWQAMCSEWATNCLSADEAKKLVQPIEDALLGVPVTQPISIFDANEQGLLFEK